jgi:hypothetical protein
MGKGAPKAPDPVATANAQASANKEAVRESAKVNAVNVYSPYGNVTYSKNASGLPTAQNITLTPTAQKQLNAQQNLGLDLTNRAQGMLRYVPSDQFTLKGIPNAPSNYDLNAERQRAEQAYYNRGMGMLRPEFDQQTQAVEQQVSDRGLPFAGDAASALRDQEFRRQQQAREGLLRESLVQGAAEQERMFNQGQRQRQQSISEALLQRQQPFQEAAAFFGAAPQFQAPQQPNIPQYQVGAPDVMGAIYQNYAGQQQAAAQRGSALGNVLGTAGQIGAAYLMRSDRRLKENIIPVGEQNGFTLYEFNYTGEPQRYRGVMAQEVIETRPDAVTLVDGYLAVDYGAIGLTMEAINNV